ncbi:MAG TPA: ABC transporter permease [Acidimicrobiales bacterium]|nr:ABC transporter permease [Acidimicrobiales bacterium]
MPTDTVEETDEDATAQISVPSGPPDDDRPDAWGSLAAHAKTAWDHPVAGSALKALLAYVVLIEIVVQGIFGRVDLGPISVGLQDSAVPRAIFLNGASIGLLYALLGVGLILVYRANRIINFAQAQLGSVPAVAALLLIGRRDVNYFVVLPLVIFGAAALGAAVDVLIIRRFREAPRLILTVATIGVSLVLVGAEFFVQTAITGSLLSSSDFRTPFTGIELPVPGPLVFSGDFAVAAIVALALVAALAAFFRFTDMGIAVRASAENGERASLLGIPTKRVSTVVWVIAAVLSAIAVFMRAPMVGLTLGSSIGPSVLLYGLAAAVIARMEKISICLAAGIGIGIIDQAALFGTRRANLAIATMLVVILIALLVQRGALSRAYETGAGTWQAVKEFRPIPTELRGTREVLIGKSALAGLVGLVVVVLPLFLPRVYAGRFTLLAIYAMVGVSLVILTGWAGQISLGQFAFSGIGAAVAGGLAANHNTDFFVSLLLGALAGAFVAVLIGLPAVRIQGLFLAVTTLAFAFTVENFVLRREYFGWLLPRDLAAVERPILYGRFDTSSDIRFYYVVLVFLALTLLAARSLRKNRTGRILIGARDNGRAVQAYGVSLARTRLTAFAISGFIAALAGGLLAYQSMAVDAGTYAPDRSISFFAMTVIGGLTSLPGAMLGAIYVEGLPFFFNNSNFVRLLTSGVGLLVLLLFLPGGLSEALYRTRDRFLRWVAARNGIHVPSLVADSLEEAAELQKASDMALTAAERHIEEIEVVDHAELIGCPTCGARVPVAEAVHHEHFTVAHDDPDSVLLVPDRGQGGSTNGIGHGTTTSRRPR